MQALNITIFGIIALSLDVGIVNVFFPCNSPFHGYFFSFTLQCNPTCVRGNFGLKLQNSPKLPHLRARLYCDAND